MKNNNSQSQTKNFFILEAKNGSKRAFKKDDLYANTIQQRDNYVENFFIKDEIKYYLDVGCGFGDLLYRSLDYVKNAVGIDFSYEMITLPKNNSNGRKKIYNKIQKNILKKAGIKFFFAVESRDFSLTDLKENTFDLPRYDCNEFIL